jgi:hypothetical protein
MARATQGALRGILVGAARQLIADARAARREMDLHHPDRDFYLGVEAAADEVVHPELGVTRPPSWPDETAPGFRDGYLRTTAMLAAAMSAEAPPVRLALPQPGR